jgi:hypothetical protein
MRNALNRTIIGGTLVAIGPLLLAKDSAKTSGTDRIDVIAHIAISGGPVVQVTAGDHWQHSYLYVDHGSSGTIDIFDVTDPAAPKAAGTLNLNEPTNETVSAVVGKAMLVTSAPSLPVPQTVTILSFADPEHPRVAQQFSGVTAILKDMPANLIYLTNPDGLWVLRLDPAKDVQLEREYDRHILYDH